MCAQKRILLTQLLKSVLMEKGFGFKRSYFLTSWRMDKYWIAIKSVIGLQYGRYGLNYCMVPFELNTGK